MPSQNFTLHPQLQADTALLGDMPLCRVLLRCDARFPWLILVPRRQGATEMTDLEEHDQLQLMRDTVRASKALTELYRPDKINIAALGNIVAQLHVHVVARFINDDAWPQPVFGHGEAKSYTESEIENLTEKLRQALELSH